mgnify:CR=1 FL=1
MKVGIDSYCYHRFFGEVYPHQNAPAKQMTMEDFIRRAKELDVDGVSLESCFIPRFDKAYLSEIKGMLDELFGLCNWTMTKSLLCGQIALKIRIPSEVIFSNTPILQCFCG